jgi:dTDP-D-glucose 4,6-dehydratase
MERLLVAGDADFIGTNFVRRVLDVQPDWTIVAYDALTYAGNFAAGLRDTVRWYIEHEPWWRAIKSGEYRQYYERQYGAGGVNAPV